MHHSVQNYLLSIISYLLYCFVCSTQGDWDVLLPAAIIVLNLTCLASTGHSPIFVFYGSESVLPLSIIFALQLMLLLLLQLIVFKPYLSLSLRSILLRLTLLPQWLKLPASIVGTLFPVLYIIGPVSFKLQLPDDWVIHKMFHVSYSKLVIGISDTLDTAFHPEADGSGEFEVWDILDSHTVTLHGLIIDQFLENRKGLSVF